MIREQYNIDGPQHFVRKGGQKPKGQVFLEQSWMNKHNGASQALVKEEDNVEDETDQLEQQELYDAYSKQNNRKVLHNYLQDKQTQSERSFYTNVGSYPTPGGVGEFDICTSNTKELYL